MKKKPKYTIRRLLASTGVALLAAVSADAVTLRKDGKGRSEKIINKSILQVDLTSGGKGWIVYPSNFSAGGNWWNSFWQITGGQTYLKAGRHFIANSPGYPKVASSIPNKQARFNCRIAPNFRMRGRWQNGMYLWLDNNNTGLGTHELNFWQTSYSKTRPYTFHGRLHNNGSWYNIYSFNNSGFKSWVLVRQSYKLGANITYKKFVDKLRSSYGMPNHNVINMMAAAEGHNSGSKGDLRYWNYGIPTL